MRGLRRKPAGMARFIAMAGHWIGSWIFYVCVVCAIGAGLGVLSHVAVGTVFLDGYELSYLAAFGFLNGLKYGSVWAGGVALVLCFIKGHREYEARQRAAADTDSKG